MAKKIGRAARSSSPFTGVLKKVEAWWAQRDEIARELRALADRVSAGDTPSPFLPPETRPAGDPLGPYVGKGRRIFTAAQRKAQSQRMKAAWAKRKSKSSARIKR
jgi:hypothetical protein